MQLSGISSQQRLAGFLLRLPSRWQPESELQAQEPGELHRQHPCGGRGRDGHVDDRQPVIIIRVAVADVPLVGSA
jgi:hypothetical protein